MRYLFILMIMLFTTKSYAHEMVPAYPKLEQSFVDNVLKAELTLFNRRQDIQYYQIAVFDNEWEPMPFATETNIIQLDYLSRKKFTVYIREADGPKAGWVCTRSKILKGQVAPLVSSRICSKFKSED